MMISRCLLATWLSRSMKATGHWAAAGGVGGYILSIYCDAVFYICPGSCRRGRSTVSDHCMLNSARVVPWHWSA